MRGEPPVRVLWLLNQPALRASDTHRLQSIGITEIFAPKSFRLGEDDTSSGGDGRGDGVVTLPPEELQLLDRQDWQRNVDPIAWEIANRRFDVAFVGFVAEQMRDLSRYFAGAIVLRVLGREGGRTLTSRLYEEIGIEGYQRLQRLGSRFCFAPAYPHVADAEGKFLKGRICHLPMSWHRNVDVAKWTGSDPRLLFICPQIRTSEYGANAYAQFIEAFGDLPYTIGGEQLLKVSDPNVAGFTSRAQDEQNMRELRVMFYESTEPDQLRCHPFEALRWGLPLIFMAGGPLDKLGGTALPGRARTASEARAKVRRLLGGDRKFIDRVRESQKRLLASQESQSLGPTWQVGLDKILAGARHLKSTSTLPKSRKRILVLLPIGYRGGSLRGAILLAEALLEGSRQAGDEADIILAHIDDPEVYSDEHFEMLPPQIERRPFVWRTISAEVAQRTMGFAGLADWRPTKPEYMFPDDGIQQFSDCHLWVIVSDRLEKPIVPLKPTVMMVYDYLQRYVPILKGGADQPFLDAARQADAVLVTTEFTRQDALQYAGIAPSKLSKVPMLVPQLERPPDKRGATNQYFVWTTNSAIHKNHENAFRALEIYYEKYGGTLACAISGANTGRLLNDPAPYLAPLRSIVSRSAKLKQSIRLLGELSDRDYRATLAGASFLWHAGQIDNGTFSVVEAACLGIPSLSTGYPAMREIDEMFALGMSWMPADRPAEMGYLLHVMEKKVLARDFTLPSFELIQQRSDIKVASSDYWSIVNDLL